VICSAAAGVICSAAAGVICSAAEAAVADIALGGQCAEAEGCLSLCEPSWHKARADHQSECDNNDS
jgi:hypothetical protein